MYLPSNDPDMSHRKASKSMFPVYDRPRPGYLLVLRGTINHTSEVFPVRPSSSRWTHSESAQNGDDQQAKAGAPTRISPDCGRSRPPRWPTESSTAIRRATCLLRSRSLIVDWKWFWGVGSLNFGILTPPYLGDRSGVATIPFKVISG